MQLINYKGLKDFLLMNLMESMLMCLTDIGRESKYRLLTYPEIGEKIDS